MSSVSNAHSNFCSELSVKNLKRILRDIVGGTGSLDSDAVTQALLSHANTKCKVLKKSPAELAFGRCLKDFFPRNVNSLLPIPENLMTGEVKDKLQGKLGKMVQNGGVSIHGFCQSCKKEILYKCKI